MKVGAAMLDKQLPYAEIWMTRPLEEVLPDYPLNEQYHFEKYRPGAEKDWAAIETAVGEFDSIDEALAYFDQAFAPYQEELTKRMFFVVNEKMNALRHALLGGSFVKKNILCFIGWRSNRNIKEKGSREV